jgi:hypothetical protein
MDTWIWNVQYAIGPKIDIDRREVNILALVFGYSTCFQGIYLVVGHQKIDDLEQEEDTSPS